MDTNHEWTFVFDNATRVCKHPINICLGNFWTISGLKLDRKIISLDFRGCLFVEQREVTEEIRESHVYFVPLFVT